jgi:excisionase family DNA binding protein
VKFMAVVTVKGAAEHTGLSEWRIRILAKEGKIPHVMAGSKYLFRTETLDKWFQEQEKLSVIQQEAVDKRGTLRKVKE